MIKHIFFLIVFVSQVLSASDNCYKCGDEEAPIKVKKKRGTEIEIVKYCILCRSEENIGRYEHQRALVEVEKVLLSLDEEQRSKLREGIIGPADFYDSYSLNTAEDEKNITETDAIISALQSFLNNG